MKLSKAGFTLMELLVYMGIVGIVVVIAGEAFSNSTKFRVRTDNMIKATQEAENVGTLFKTDVEQLGTKVSKESGNAAGGALYGDNFGATHTSVYMDPANGDSSSFILTPNGDYSDLTFRRLRYDTDGFYVATEEVHWYVEDKTLKRSCSLLDMKSGYAVPSDELCAHGGGDPQVVDMATGVEKFNVIAATPSATTDMVQVFPSSGDEFRLVPHNSENQYVGFKITNTSGDELIGGTGAVLSKFYSNYDNEHETVVAEHKINEAYAIKDETTADVNWKNLCSSLGRLTLEKDQEYEISFNVTYPGSTSDRSLLFVPGVDHMSVGFRDISTGHKPKVSTSDGDVVLIDDFMFFPPLSPSGSGVRSMRFHVPQKVENVCMSFSFACFSPLVSQGSITIKNLKLKKVATSDYKFPPDVPAFDTEANKLEKKNVKALKVELQVSRGAKGTGKGETGEVSLIIPIPSNGLRD